MAYQEHQWGSKDYDEGWVAKDRQRTAEREAQFRATTRWLGVFLEGRGKVMDLGCGPGTLAEKLLATFPEMEVVCVDGSEAMIDLAKQSLSSYGQRASFAQADFGQDQWTANLPRDLDGVVSARAIHNLRKLKPIEMVYRGICEILRPGGLFINVERVNFSTPSLRKFYRELRKRETGRQPGMDGAAPNLLQQFHLLKRAGFQDIDCFWREGNTALVGGCKKASSS